MSVYLKHILSLNKPSIFQEIVNHQTMKCSKDFTITELADAIKKMYVFKINQRYLIIITVLQMVDYIAISLWLQRAKKLIKNLLCASNYHTKIVEYWIRCLRKKETNWFFCSSKREFR